jgi:hypothetical protein
VKLAALLALPMLAVMVGSMLITIAIGQMASGA